MFSCLSPTMSYSCNHNSCLSRSAMVLQHRLSWKSQTQQGWALWNVISPSMLDFLYLYARHKQHISPYFMASHTTNPLSSIHYTHNTCNFNTSTSWFPHPTHTSNIYICIDSTFALFLSLIPLFIHGFIIIISPIYLSGPFFLLYSVLEWYCSSLTHTHSIMSHGYQ